MRCPSWRTNHAAYEDCTPADVELLRRWRMDSDGRSVTFHAEDHTREERCVVSDEAVSPAKTDGPARGDSFRNQTTRMRQVVMSKPGLIFMLTMVVGAIIFSMYAALSMAWSTFMAVERNRINQNRSSIATWNWTNKDWPKHALYKIVHEAAPLRNKPKLDAELVGWLTRGPMVPGERIGDWLRLDDDGIKSLKGYIIHSRGEIKAPAWVLVNGKFCGMGRLLRRCCPADPVETADFVGNDSNTANDGSIGNASFPEVDYIYVPEVERDVKRSKQMLDEYDRLVPAGSGVIRMMRGVYPKLWPSGGRYDKVESFAQELQTAHHVGTGASDNSSDNWWNEKNLHYAEVDQKGKSTFMQIGLGHHAGCGLSHFVTWMDARQRGVKVAVIAESDGFVSRFEQLSVGSVCDFTGVVRAILEEAPLGWHLVQLDKGKHGVIPGSRPVKHMQRKGLGRRYNIYRWTGEGVAGAALYMVSSRFLNQVPQMIHDHGFDMVDAYIGKRCAADGGSLWCYSVVSSDVVLLASKAGILYREANEACECAWTLHGGACWNNDGSECWEYCCQTE